MSPSLVVTFKISAQVQREGRYYTASCPDLDVASQGTTEEEALNNLAEAVQLFVVSCYERGTLEQVLKESGYRPMTKARSLDIAEDHVLEIPFPLYADRQQCHV